MRPELSPNLDLAALSKTHEAVIPERFLDEMGHMNVAWYSHLFSEAMGGMMDLFGLTLDYIEKERIGGVALEVHLNYLAEVRVQDRIAIYSRMIERTEKRLHLIHFMYNESRDELAALFENVMACFDLTTRRMAPIPGEFAARVDELIAAHQALEWPAPVCGVMKA